MKKKFEKKEKMFKILGAKNRRKYLHKHPGPPFQIRGGPGCFSIAVHLISAPYQPVRKQMYDYMIEAKSLLS